MTTLVPGEAEVGLEHVLVDRYTDIVGPSNEMLGPVRDGGHIEYLTVPGCWGPMITPSIRSGHEVTLPVRVVRAWVGLTEHSPQHPIVSLATADLVGVMTRCRISIGNLGSIPAIDLPSSHNCGDFGAFLVGAEHEFAVTEEELEQRTDVHMDVD